MQSLRVAIAATVPLTLPCAQAGNEVVFVGSSVGGGNDPHHFVESGTGALLAGASNYTDNVTDAVWADTGRNLYVAQGLQSRVSRAQWNGSAASWSPFYPAPGGCYGLGMDTGRRRLWTLTGPSASTSELHCLDADPSSPGYGTLLAATTVLAGVTRERWGLSPSGNLAAVPSVFLGGVTIVDTDPGSPTFLQVVGSAPVLGPGGSFAAATAAAVSGDDQYAYVLWTGVGSAGLAVLHIATQTWLDFDPAPGHQDMALGAAQVPNAMALSLAGTFAVVSGQGGSGAVVRIDFDHTTPANTTVTQLGLGLGLPNCSAVSLSPEDTRVAVGATSPVRLVILDVQTGATIHNLTLANMSSAATTAWQDASPTATFTPYGTGCAGTAGVPTWTATPGSRPALGSTFSAVAGNLPFGIAVLQFGLTNAPGGVDLTFLGMPACFLYPSPIASFALIGAGSSAAWQFGVPNTQSLFGAEFHTQAFPLDPAANAFGFTASNAALGAVGF